MPAAAAMLRPPCPDAIETAPRARPVTARVTGSPRFHNAYTPHPSHASRHPSPLAVLPLTTVRTTTPDVRSHYFQRSIACQRGRWRRMSAKVQMMRCLRAEGDMLTEVVWWGER